MNLLVSIQQNLLTPVWGAINRKLNRSDIRSFCLIILVVYALTLGASFVSHANGRNLFGQNVGADFAAFYIAGKIFYEQWPDLIYDRDLQRQYYREFFPDNPPGMELPYVNAPFFVTPFPFLARLPYGWAYFCWLVISLGLFVTGFGMIWRRLDLAPGDDYRTALLLGVSFMPFLVECVAGGQTSAFGFYWFALAFSFDRRGRRLLSGMALAFCLYKLPLLALALPMLVFTRRYATIAGVALGGLFLSVISLLVVGWRGCQEYLKALLFFADTSTGAETVLKSWKYVDVNSFFRLLLNDHFYLRWTLTIAAVLLIAPLLFKALWKADRQSEADQNLVWAATITWTLVLNIYLGIYDVTLAALGALLTFGALYRRADLEQEGLGQRFKLLLFLLYVTPWITKPIARTTGFQLLTLVIAAFGFYQIGQLSRGAKLLRERPGS